MGSAVRRFLEVVERCHLERTLPKLAYDIREARAGRMAEDRAGYMLRYLQPLLEKRDPIRVHPLEWPTPNGLNGDSPPDIELDCLRDHPDVRFRARLLDRARSVIVVGAVGAGKSTAIRNIIAGVDRLATQRRKPISIWYWIALAVNTPVCRPSSGRAGGTITRGTAPGYASTPEENESRGWPQIGFS